MESEFICGSYVEMYSVKDGCARRGTVRYPRFDFMNLKKLRFLHIPLNPSTAERLSFCILTMKNPLWRGYTLEHSSWAERFMLTEEGQSILTIAFRLSRIGYKNNEHKNVAYCSTQRKS